MLKELFKFCVVYLLIFMVFLSSGMILFYDLHDFETNWKGAIYLFNAMLGNFDFSIFAVDGALTQKDYGWTYLILFLVFTNIVLINFLIAILSSKYTEMESKGKVLNRKTVLNIKQVICEDEYYSSLVISFVPMNVFILPFVPFIALFRIKKLNCLLLFISYMPMVIIGTGIFIAGSLIALPFAYLIMISKS